MVSVSELINKKRQQVADKRAGNLNAYTFKQPVTTIRILPGWRKDGDPTFFHDFGQTWIKNMDGAVLAVVADAKITFGNDDAVRNLVHRALAGANSDAQRKHYKEMLAKSRVLVNAQVLDDKSVDANVAHILEFSEAGFTAVIEQAALAGIADEFLSLDEGFDLIVSKTGKGFDTKYTYTFARKPRAVPDSVRESLNDVDAFIRAKFADSERALNAIKSLVQGQDVLKIEDRSTDYSGDSDIVDGSFDAVEDARTNAAEPEVEVDRQVRSDADIDSLFD